jgi:hypothetical protein
VCARPSHHPLSSPTRPTYGHPPAIVGSDIEPVFPGLSPDDVLTLYFTRPTNRPSVSSTLRVQALLSFTPPLATVLQANWQSGGDDVQPNAAERLVITLSGTVNNDVVGTLVSAVRVSILRSGGLRDVDNSCQNTSVSNMSMGGSWGAASQPLFLALQAGVAMDYGAQPGLGPGDALLLRFNQPVRQVPVGSTALVDALLSFSPPASLWATNYTGTWVAFTALLVTVLAVPGGVVGAGGSAAVGSLAVTVLPSGNLTSYDGTSTPSNASTTVTAGSWGETLCDSGVFVGSHTSLVVALSVPPGSSYTPSEFRLLVSTSPSAGAGATTLSVLGPAAFSATVAANQSEAGIVLPTNGPTVAGGTADGRLRFVVPGLVTGTPYYTWMAVLPPTLPIDVVLQLPKPVSAVYQPIATGPCTCGAASAGASLGCHADWSVASPMAVAPALPIIGTATTLDG